MGTCKKTTVSGEVIQFELCSARITMIAGCE